MSSTDHTLVTDLLTALKVPFTKSYTKQRYESMSFQTLFGVNQLLKEYGVESQGYKIGDKAELAHLKPPFIAQTQGGLVIVMAISGNDVDYLTQGVSEKIPLSEFQEAWTGNVLIPTVTPAAKEPDYEKHRIQQLIETGKKAMLVVLVAALAVFMLITTGSWRHPSVWGLIAVDCFGLWITYLLVQKSLSIKNSVADKVCGVLQSGGCDSILKTSASSFFGIFSWSEVGITYFGVSLLVTLLVPGLIHWLSLINICCLPFTVWSIWYQKFRAKHWCTLCVCVQLSLWVQFFCYLAGKWQSPILPLSIDFFALGATFVMVLLGLNRLLPHFTNKSQD